MIEFVNVTKAYPGRLALDNVSFEIDEKEFVFLVGPSGSGKTTIIKLLIREEIPSSGKVFFYDTDVSKISGSKISQLRREIGVVFQDFKLLPQKNLFENIAFAMEVAGRNFQDIQQTVPYVLELVELSDRAQAFPGQLSGGEKQKIAIARALVNNPKVLIADEPTGNLDPESSWEVIDLLNKINQWGTTVIMATHGSEIVNSLGKRVLHLQKGKLISDNKKGIYPGKPVILQGEKDIEKSPRTDLKPTEKPEKEKKSDIKDTKEKQIKKEKKDKKKDLLKKKLQKATNKDNKIDSTKAKDTSDATTDLKEKEFEITFTTKQTFPGLTSKHKKKRKKRKGNDFVDITKLKLPPKIEEILLKNQITSIESLKKLSSEELEMLQGMTMKRSERVIKALEKFS